MDVEHGVSPRSRGSETLVAVMVRHAFDRVFAAAALVIAAPVMLLIAAALKATSDGPVIAREPRIGHDWRRFDLLRFSTDGSRFGAALHRTSLDELPQLVNVLLGHMSVVGPRPLPPERVAALLGGVRPAGTRRSGMAGTAPLRALLRARRR